MLEVKNLSAYYGAITGLQDVSLICESEAITCIIGSNGAGKTTLLKSISGMVSKSGEILWDGKSIASLSARKIAKLGIIQVPEGRHIFPGLTVRENLEVGTISWHGMFGRGKFQQDLEQVYELFPRLKEREKQKGWSLSGGEQQMLAIGRAIMARPKMLMLDEPSMGLAPQIIDDLFSCIQELNRKLKLPILLVEQNAALALEVSSYGYVIEQGKIRFHGKAADLRGDPRIEEAYLGHFTEEMENS